MFDYVLTVCKKSYPRDLVRRSGDWPIVNQSIGQSVSQSVSK